MTDESHPVGLDLNSAHAIADTKRMRPTLRGEADHLAQQCRIGTLLQQLVKAILSSVIVVFSKVSVASQPTLPRSTAVTPRYG
jgi:hypothetical protein